MTGMKGSVAASGTQSAAMGWTLDSQRHCARAERWPLMPLQRMRYASSQVHTALAPERDMHPRGQEPGIGLLETARASIALLPAQAFRLPQAGASSAPSRTEVREPRRALTMLMKFALERRPRRQRGAARRPGRHPRPTRNQPLSSPSCDLVVTKARARHNLVRRGLWERTRLLGLQRQAAVSFVQSTALEQRVASCGLGITPEVGMPDSSLDADGAAKRLRVARADCGSAMSEGPRTAA
ncbi:hypothetical protein L1887_62299 [Cichorium endivia]|nr:hypothetical protein L1887_62299 [Cichorium endivia]